MLRILQKIVAAVILMIGLLVAEPVSAQKSGGVLKIYHRDSPASMSIHEEGTNSVAIPMMAVFNNLVLYDQHKAQNSLDTIVPDLAESWSWNEEGTRLTFKLRQGVKWHDGKPFTSADVKCTWDLLTGRAAERLRLNPRKSWWNNVAEIATDSPTEATFVLKRPQPAILALIASGYTPVYPCHVSPRDMRQHPIGTGPFKFVEFKPNESYQARSQSRLLEAGAALSRRHRIHDHPQPLDRDPRLHRRQVRPDLSLRGHRAADEGRQEPGAAGGLRAGAEQRQHQSAGQPRGAALRQSRSAARARIGARPQELYRHPRRGAGRHRRGDAAAAGWGLGHAARGTGNHSRLWPRCGQEPRRGARNHGPARLRARQAARDQGRRAQHRGLSRPGDHPDRPAQGRSGSTASSTRSRPPTGSPSSPARTTRSASTTPAAASTTPTSNSSRITAAARSATTPAIATPSSRNGSSSSPRRPTATSAGVSSGTSTSNCRRTARARSSTTPVPPPACSRSSKGSPSWSTASTTGGASRICGWTNRRPACPITFSAPARSGVNSQAGGAAMTGGA